jgi:AcrR family transcriptional regulator
MSPRIRQISDSEVLAAAATVISTLGQRATLADVAAAAGIAPPTLIQRYGSKRGLMLILARQGFGGAAEALAAERAIHASRVEALISALCQRASSLAPDPAMMCMQSSGVEGGASDPDFREIAGKQVREWEQEIRTVLEEAVLWGELRSCDTGELARLVQAVYSGSLCTWAVVRRGTAADSVRQQLEALMGPYLTS